MVHRCTAIALVLTLASALSACGSSSDDIFTLYRNSVLDDRMRIHVATFDATDHEGFNRGNCEDVARMYQDRLLSVADAGRAVGPDDAPMQRWWCEAGRYQE